MKKKLFFIKKYFWDFVQLIEKCKKFKQIGKICDIFSKSIFIVFFLFWTGDAKRTNHPTSPPNHQTKTAQRDCPGGCRRRASDP